jgi:hypothetical protein
MTFTDYASFRLAVHMLLDGDDISQSDLSVATLDLIIASGEDRVYRNLRSSTMETALTGSASSNALALPSDFIELKNLRIAGYKSAVFAPYEALESLIQQSTTTSARSAWYSFEGDYLVFYPKLPNGTAITGLYIKRFAALSTALNALFTRHPDVFLYAALAESAPFLGEMERLPIWEQKYQSLVTDANEQERRRQTRGSKLSTRIA